MARPSLVPGSRRSRAIAASGLLAVGALLISPSALNTGGATTTVGMRSTTTSESSVARAVPELSLPTVEDVAEPGAGGQSGTGDAGTGDTGAQPAAPIADAPAVAALLPQVPVAVPVVPPVEGAATGAAACPTEGFGGVAPHVAQAGYHLMATFGLSESEVGGVASRPGNPTSDHPSGYALDFMVDNPTGDALAAYAAEHQSELGISYIMWQVPDHYDHVHISFTKSPGSGLSC